LAIVCICLIKLLVKKHKLQFWLLHHCS